MAEQQKQQTQTQEQNLKGKKVAILVADGFEQVELTEPRKALDAAGAQTSIVSPKKDKVRGWNFTDWGVELKVDVPLAQAKADEFDALLLPGGHAPGMRQYLGSAELQRRVGEFWALDRPVGAICHGVLVLARTVDPATGVSVLADRTTTCLPKYMERSAYVATAWKLGRYYRTYPAYVEDEVRAALADPATQFQRGPHTLSRRGTETDDTGTFVVEDGRYVSARWPGDAYAFARALLARLDRAERKSAGTA